MNNILQKNCNMREMVFCQLLIETTKTLNEKHSTVWYCCNCRQEIKTKIHKLGLETSNLNFFL